MRLSSGHQNVELTSLLRHVAPSVNARLLEAIVTSRPHEGPAAASEIIASKPLLMREVLTVLFGRGNLETAHGIISRCNIDMSEELICAIRRSLSACGDVLDKLRESCVKELNISHLSGVDIANLFELYVQHREHVMDCVGVRIPGQDEVKKFMLLESTVGLLVRVGEPLHRNIIEDTKRELLALGRLKAALALDEQGGGWLGAFDSSILVYGESTEFGRANFEMVRRLLLQAYPEREISLSQR